MGTIPYRVAVRLRGEHSVFRRVDELRRLERRNPAEVAGVQRQLLADVLQHALANALHYRDWSALAGDLSPSSAVAVLRQLPILEKKTLQEHSERLRVENWRGRYWTKTTGGSTGAPVTVLKNPEAIAQEMAGTWLGYGWFDTEPGDPSVRFWGRPPRNLRRRLRYLAADLAVHRRTLSAFGYVREDLGKYIRRIERFRPVYLYGYVSALEDLARYMLDSGRRFESGFLRHVITTAEVLTPPQRACMEEAFGVRVQNEYGCGEVGPIALECPEGSLHLLPTNQYVEILQEDGAPAPAGEPGYIVLTDLTNRVMPLIRYRVGDMGSLGDGCGCGRPFPVLADVFGREYDFVEAPDGRRFHGEFFMYLFEDLRQTHPEIGQFQVAQLDHDSLAVMVVLAAGAAASTEADIQAELHRRLPAFRSTVERVDRLERRPSGKMRVVENRVSRKQP